MRSGLLPRVEAEAAVFRRTSSWPFDGRGGERGSFCAEVARLNHPKGVVTLRPKDELGGGGGGCGDGARASEAFLLGGAPHGTEGKEAENPWNLEGRAGGFGGSVFSG